jgi:L-ascorbate metabolism protein UlaG (beta-lactamase superfamily)
VSDGDDHGRRVEELERLNRKRRPRRFRSLVLHWISRSIGRRRAARREPLPAVNRGQVSITYIGQRSALIRYAGVTIACDPCFRRRVGLAPREVEPGIKPGDLNGVDVILLSNTDPLSLDLEALDVLPRRALVVVPPGVAKHLSSLGFDRVLELAPAQTFQVKGIGIHTVETRRDTSPGLAFVLRGNGPTLFYCSSSAYSRTFREVGLEFQPDLALLPIAGYSPRSFRRRAMSPIDALYAFEDLKARILIPISFGSFALSYERLDDPSTWFRELVSERNLDSFVVHLEPGQSRIFTNPSRARRPTPYLASDRAVELAGGDAVLAM